MTLQDYTTEELKAELKRRAENFGIDYMDVNDFVNTNLED